MSSNLLATELANLISESKRKNNDLRNAAEKSLQDLKSLSVTSEQQLAADVSRRPAFIEPFLLACGTRNARFAGSGVACLQRLVVARGLPKGRLAEAVEAFNACTDLSLDIQLKVLQALPSLVQNYADDLEDELLRGTLLVCSSLQAAKVPTVSGVAAATLQQLVTSVFEKVADEDRRAKDAPTVAEIPGDEGKIAVRRAAYDAYRVFRDLVLATEDRKTKFVDLKDLPREVCLELVWSCVDANPNLIDQHKEFSSIVRSNVLPFVTQALSERPNFSMTVRCIRILDVIILRHMSRFPGECEIALGLMAHGLDAEASPGWKRCLYMEVLRNFFSDPTLVIAAYRAFDASQDGKSVVQDILSAFVRLSTEKPAIIGLGQQSTVPTGPDAQRDQVSEQATIEAAGGMAGVISSALGVMEASVPGISSQWSTPRSQCIDQLDKSAPPTLPETYIYSLVLECLSQLSDNLAKVVLPLTVQHERSKGKREAAQEDSRSNGDRHSSGIRRSQSFRKRAVPQNPLDIEGPMSGRVKAVASLIESCWPAVLATTSTFLNAALDDQYYRNLIKAYQRFAQVAGLLRLSTPRDALMTTLGKAAVPPQVLNAASTENVGSPSTDSPRVFSNPRNLLSVESLMSHSSSASFDRSRRSSIEPSRSTLTIRNLLCLRALLNLAIALGPTLGDALAVVVEVLKQADMVLSAAGPHQLARPGSSHQSDTDSPAVVQAFSTEIAAVESAASRLLESTSDYPNEAFVNVVAIFCRLLHGRSIGTPVSPRHEQPPGTPQQERRNFSGLPGLSTFADMQARDYQFVIPKLGNLAALNVTRFVTNPPEESGWERMVGEVMAVAIANKNPAGARRAATDLLCKLSAECIAEVSEEDEVEVRATTQRRAISVLLQVIEGIYSEDGDLANADLEVQAHILDALKAILDRSGESLVAGWSKTLAIVSTVFEGDKTSISEGNDEETNINWTEISNSFISPRLGRDAFGTVQLICSDFLGLLPSAVVPALVELLHRFMGQAEDLNLSLTAITTTWNLSDVIFDESASSVIEKLEIRTTDEDVVEKQIQSEVNGASPNQWLLVLLRLRQIVRSSQPEARKAAFQTLCSICNNQGSKLSPEAWSTLLHSIVFGVILDDAGQINEGSEQDGASSTEMTGIILGGTAAVVAQQAEVISQIPQLTALWKILTSALATTLKRQSLDTSADVFKSLATMLRALNRPLKVWEDPVNQTFALWLDWTPPGSNDKNSNQPAFEAYADVGAELHRLLADDLATQKTTGIVKSLYECVRASDASYYNADVHNLSPLQTKVLSLLKSMAPDSSSSRQCLIATAASFTMLHKATADQISSSRPSFIAIAGESIYWLQNLILPSLDDMEVFTSEAMLKATSSLADLVEQKYNMRIDYKGSMLWRRATDAALSLAQPLLDRASAPKTAKEISTALWNHYVRLASAIALAPGLEHFHDPQRTYADQNADISALSTLHALLVPRLGSPELPNELRASYSRALFTASLIHTPEPHEIPPSGNSPLGNFNHIRRGRVKKVPFSRREQLSYLALSTLIALSSPSAPLSLAREATPLLMLRLAVPIRAYIADQPLRGRAPQPLSEKEELVYCCEMVGSLELHDEAIEGKGSKAHLRYLYPLMMKAVGTAGDRWSGDVEVLEVLQRVLEGLDVFG